MSTCEHCGDPFRLVHNAGKPQRFCGEKCRKKAEKKRSIKRSREFRDVARLEETGLQWHEQRCGNCSTVFPKYNDPDNRQGWRRYCSSECAEETKKKQREAAKALPRNVECKECGKNFSTTLPQKYCSKECGRNAANRNAYDKRFRGHPITRDEFLSIEEAQKRRCKICNEEAFLCVDHCHTGGHVRGLLCRQCNSGLGMFKDSVENLSAAIRYLSE